MTCPKCQAENKEDAGFCHECGRPNLLISNFCDGCGHDLGKPKAPAVDYAQPRSYTPRFLADKILSTGKSLEGERKLVTVLFADMASYTAMSEKLDPEKVLRKLQ